MSKKQKKDIIPLDYLKLNVYPELHQALICLIEHVLKTEELRKHQEKLIKIKIFDKLEQRRTEKDRLKQELGSEYESSDDSVDWEEMGIDKEEIERFLKKKEKKKKKKDDDEDNEDNEKQSDQNKLSRQNSKEQKELDEEQQKSKEKEKLELDQIQEKEEQVEEEKSNEKSQLDQMKLFLQKQREVDQYNPLIHLSELLREVIKNRK